MRKIRGNFNFSVPIRHGTLMNEGNLEGENAPAFFDFSTIYGYWGQQNLLFLYAFQPLKTPWFP